jgi:hypothetical protein
MFFGVARLRVNETRVFTTFYSGVLENGVFDEVEDGLFWTVKTWPCVYLEYTCERHLNVT